MKTPKNFLLSLLILHFVSFSYSTTRTIEAAGLSFTPTPLSAAVGDTIKWVWISGDHTTTSTTIPSGAASWNAPLTSVNTSYTYVITHSGTYDYVCIPHQSFGMVGVINVSPIGIEPVSSSIPEVFKLEQNFPNPFNPSTNIRFDLPKSSRAVLEVYNITGELQAILFNGELNAGSYIADWDASGFASGVYLYVLKTDEFIESKKMVLAK